MRYKIFSRQGRNIKELQTVGVPLHGYCFLNHFSSLKIILNRITSYHCTFSFFLFYTKFYLVSVLVFGFTNERSTNRCVYLSLSPEPSSTLQHLARVSIHNHSPFIVFLLMVVYRASHLNQTLSPRPLLSLGPTLIYSSARPVTRGCVVPSVHYKPCPAHETPQFILRGVLFFVGARDKQRGGGRRAAGVGGSAWPEVGCDVGKQTRGIYGT